MEIFAQDSVVRKGFMKGVELENLSNSVLPILKEQLLVAGEGFVRVIAWEADELRVLDQFNSKISLEITTPIKIDWEGKGAHEIFAFHEDGYWQRMYAEKNEQPRQPVEASFLVPNVATNHVSGGARMLALGGITGDFTQGSQKLSLEVETGILLIFPKFVIMNRMRFNNDGVTDLVCLDGKKNLLEFLN